MLRDLFVGLCVGGALSGVAFLLTATFQNELEHQEILDNTLFTRQLSLTDGPKPLSGLNLRETELPNLDLSGANLARADLTSADLHGTDLRDANLSEANLHAADLTYANLFNSLISGANFTGADLTGANLEGLVFMPNLGGICYDDSTVWPEDFEIELPSSC